MIGALVAFTVLGCKGATPHAAQAPNTATADGTCAELGGHITRFAEVLEDLGEAGKPRRASYGRA